MQFNKLIKLSVIIIICISSYAHASSYPQTREERIADEMGSMAGGEGIVFRPSHVKNDQTKAEVASNKKINKFLWEAAREVLKFVPTSTLDRNNGIIVTDWYSAKEEPNYSFKIEVTISDDVISASSIEVNVYEKRLKNGHWYNEPVSSKLSYKFADQIIRHARELYIKSQR